MWARSGLAVVAGRLRLSIDRAELRARVIIQTRGTAIDATVWYERHGEPWSFLPQHYYLLDPDRPILYLGDEWGVSHDARAKVSVAGASGTRTFETQASVDLEVGWDDPFDPIERSGPASRARVSGFPTC